MRLMILSLLFGAIGVALVQTSARAVPAGKLAGISSANIVQVGPRCGPGAHWVRGHRAPNGAWVPGHCVPNR